MLQFAAWEPFPDATIPSSYYWDFGDGRGSNLQVPGPVPFRTVGTNAISVIVSNSSLASSVSDSRIVTVVQDSGQIPDLMPTNVVITAGLAVGEQASVAYEVRNIGAGPMTNASWRDSIYLSTDTVLDVFDVLLGDVAVAINLSPDDAYTNSIPFVVPNLGEGTAYLILSVNDQWDELELHRMNNEYAVATDALIPHLTVGESLNSRFSRDDSYSYYKLVVGANQNLVVSLDDLDNAGLNALYLRFGAPPTPAAFDHSTLGKPGPDQRLVVTGATPGTWYLLAQGVTVPGSGDYTLTARTPDFELLGVSPSSVLANQDAELILTGLGFMPGASVELVASNGVSYPAASVELDSLTQIAATVQANTVLPGLYSIHLSLTNGAVTMLTNAVQVLAAGQAKLVARTLLPSVMGFHSAEMIYFEYSNEGVAAMPAPLLELRATVNGHEGARLSLENNRLVEGFWTSARPQDFGSRVAFLASGEIPGSGPEHSDR